MELRSVELELQDPEAAYAFLTGVWGALPVKTPSASRYVGGTGDKPYLVALHPADRPRVRFVTFTCSADRIAQIKDRADAAQLCVESAIASEPGQGRGIVVTLPEGERFRFLAESHGGVCSGGRDAPVKLTHVVMNSVDAERTAKVCEDVLGFRVSDRTAGMVFVRCNAAHHSVAFARAGHASLNHIAFEMADLDAVMRGIGRLRDVGISPAWGPGRHGPGANAFAYYIAPFGAVVEFSTAVEQVPHDYVTGTPEDWTWPPNRIDQWGMSNKDVALLHPAEKIFAFS